MTNLSATYDHKQYEKKWWDFWEKGRWFESVVDKNKDPYVILIPPPNVTDRLHMGHGLNNTIQDILIRWKRMQGFNCCWLPGTDHAGIATQMMVEKSLEKTGETRTGLGREEFVKRCMKWKDENGGIIIDQLKKLGASCDWKREAYTMDEHLSKAVRSVFVDLYNDGLIYRGERLVNWCPVLKTAISDDEVENKEVNGFLWYFKYPVKGSDEFVTIATTRPETMLGDTAVAINPEDERYKHLHGKTVIVPFVEREIPIVLDDYVKSEYGTGCVKITPAHDPNDFEIGKRHNLPFINVMNKDGSMNDLCPEPFKGMNRFVARKAIIKALKEKELFEKEESNKHAIPYSERGKEPIEPMLSKQWYVKMQPLAEPAIKAAQNGELNFYPDTWKKTYFHWMENIQDWCISRQLWWGHQIPIWYCGDCESTTTGMEDPTECSHCGSKKLTQDEDVLDTWFSSWLWPLSPFGWPNEKSEDLDYYFPSNVLVTGADIIFLWVARMIMAGYRVKDTLAFKDVYFNSIICDKDGQKFSKTLGNGIDPLKIIDKYGADAMRYTCISLAPLGGRVKMNEDDFESGSRFVNKLWNAARFLQSKIEGLEIKAIDKSKLNLSQKWLLNEFVMSATKINSLLEKYAINEAVETAFHMTWRAFCDWGLESAKTDFDSSNASEKENAASVLIYTFEGILRLLAPVMPFVTEEIWHAMPHHPDWERAESLVVSGYPNANVGILKDLKFEAEASDWENIQNFISGIRSVRMQAGVPPKDKVEVVVQCEPKFSQLISDAEKWIFKLSNLKSLSSGSQIAKPEKCMVDVGKGYETFVPVGEYLDFDKEKARIEAEIKRVEKIVQGLKGKLSNKNFVDRAPEDIVVQTKSQLENMESQLNSLNKNLASL